MPRRKRLPPLPDITDAGNNPETHMVQKSNPLIMLSETGLTLAELKILDAYLARVDSHDPDHRYVRFEKGTIEKYLGVTQIKPHDLEKRVSNLFQTITIKDKNKRKGFTLIALFEKAECVQDENGLWQVDLAASASAMDYVFNVENIGYLRYRLKNVVNLTSRYSYFLYLYLERNRHMHLSWEIGLDDLKKVLSCTAERYAQYKFFSAEVLKKCHRELSEKTECHYSYEPVRKGRNVVAVRFTLEPIKPSLAIDNDYDPNQYTIEDWQRSEREEICAGFSNEVFSVFTDEELVALKELAYPKHQDKISEYLTQKVANARARKVKHVFQYVMRMVENDIKESAAAGATPSARPAPQNKFINFEQREIDFDEVEEMVFGHGNEKKNGPGGEQ